ncbi:LysR family transcriptional regulator, partial [Burkholderia pseudomallei]
AGRLAAAPLAAFESARRTNPSPEVALSTTPANVTAHADNMEAIALLILSGLDLGYLPRHFEAPYVEQGLLKALNRAW